MAGYNDHEMDFFSQAPSHHPASATVGIDYSQGSSSAGDFFNPGRGMGLLDLNSNADVFPKLTSYQHLLQPDKSAGHALPQRIALPPIGPGQKSGRGGGRTRSLNIGSGSAPRMCPFVPPGEGGSMSQGATGFVGQARGTSSAGNGGITGRGFSMVQGAGRQRASSSAVPPDDVDEAEDLEDGDDSGAGGTKFLAKAAWTEENIFVFCNIACEEARDGHCVNGAWTTRAYSNMKTKYYQRAGLLHTTKQMKNCITKLKSYYNAWVWLGQQTGCGRPGNGEVTASNEWWKKIKEKPEVKIFKGGNSAYLDMLIELFQGVAVDGSSAYLPGDADEEEQVDDGYENSPMSTSIRKRGSSTGEQSSASSPVKKSKSQVVKLMRGLINTINSDNTSEMITEFANKKQEAKDKAKEKKSNSTNESITHCQKLAVECGAAETSVEYFMATPLFRDEQNRVIFQNISSIEARLIWLKRWCMMKNLQ